MISQPARLYLHTSCLLCWLIADARQRRPFLATAMLAKCRCVLTLIYVIAVSTLISVAYFLALVPMASYSVARQLSAHASQAAAKKNATLATLCPTCEACPPQQPCFSRAFNPAAAGESDATAALSNHDLLLGFRARRLFTICNHSSTVYPATSEERLRALVGNSMCSWASTWPRQTHPGRTQCVRRSVRAKSAA
jgi:hypothetical protein